MASEKCGRFLRSRQFYEREVDNAAAVAARRVHETMERQLKRICKGRLRPGREVHFMDAMGTSFATIETGREQYTVGGDGFYCGNGSGIWTAVTKVPLFEEIAKLIEEYNWASNNDFAINDVRFIT